MSAVWPSSVRIRMDWPPQQNLEFTFMPFSGLAEAARLWLHDPINLASGAATLAVIIAFTIRAIRSELSLSWAALPFVA